MKLLRKHVVAARALLSISQGELAKLAGISETTVARFESGAKPELKEATLWEIQTALEHCGIELQNGGRPGVRYHPDRDRRLLSRTEPVRPVG